MKVSSLCSFGIFLTLLLIISSCGQYTNVQSNAKSPPSSPRKVTLSLVHTFTRQDQQERLAILQSYVKTLEKENSGLTIKMSAVDEKIFRDDQLPIDMTVGNEPDIFDLFGGSDTERYAQAGRLLDLTSFLKQSGLKSKFAAGALNEFTINGHVYGLPRAGYAEGFFYNKKIFKKLGVSVPKTWEEFIKIVNKSKQAGITPIALGSKDAWVPGMLLNALIIRDVGIDHFKAINTGNYQWTNPQMQVAWNEFEKLNQLQAFPTNTLSMTYNDQIRYFENDHAAMIYTGTWSVPAFKSVSLLKNNVGFFLCPALPGGQGNQTSINAGYSNGWGFSANVTAPEKKAIYQFIKLTWSKKVQKQELIKTDLLPSIKLTDTSGIDPLMTEVLNTMKTASSSWPAYDAIVSKNVQDVFNQQLQKVIGGEITPKQALEQLQNGGITQR